MAGSIVSEGLDVWTAEPQLFVSDLEASCRFYIDRLGFTLAFVHGEPPFYGQVVRGEARLNLRRVEGPVFDAGFRAREPDALAVTVTVGDAASLFQAFERADAPFHQPLRTEPWGARTFIVRDPDANLILFAGAAG